jgi:hypothetical protein
VGFEASIDEIRLAYRAVFQHDGPPGITVEQRLDALLRHSALRFEYEVLRQRGRAFELRAAEREVVS